MDGQGCASERGDVAWSRGRLTGLSALLAICGILLVFCGQAAASSEDQWRLGSAALSESVATEWNGKLKVSDKVPGLGTLAAECTVTAEATTSPGATGELTKSTLSSCVNVSLCEGPVVQALNIPWHTELQTIEGTIREELGGGGKGTPTYKLSCEGELGKPHSECSKAELKPTVTNGTKGVTVTFSSSEKLHSSLTNENSCALEGSETLEASKGGKLSAVNAAEVTKLSETSWKVNEVIPTEEHVAWEGSVKLNVTGLGLAAECKEGASGRVVGPRGGEVKAIQLSNCVNVSQCEGPVVEALNLPWHSELVKIGGVVHDVLLGGGKGTPGFKLECPNTITHPKVTCTGALGTIATDITAGVSAVFDTSEKPRCNAPTTLEGAETISAFGRKLEV
jgi:hypothetical protein